MLPVGFSLMAVDARDAGREVLVRRGVAVEAFTFVVDDCRGDGCRCCGYRGREALLAFGTDSVIEFVAAFLVMQTLRAAGRPRP